MDSWSKPHQNQYEVLWNKVGTQSVLKPNYVRNYQNGIKSVFFALQL